MALKLWHALELDRFWRDLFNVEFDVLLYELTSTYFEANPPSDEEDKRRFGYSRDKCSDCVQVVIALVVTPQGLPLACEVLPGNTADKSTSSDFLGRIAKERAMRKRQLKRLWARFKQLSAMTLTHKELLMKLGAARSRSPSAWPWSRCRFTIRSRPSPTASSARS